MKVRVPIWRVMALVGAEATEPDKVIEFSREDFVSATGVDPEGKTEGDLAAALASAFIADTARSN